MTNGRDALDRERLSLALTLAQSAIGVTEPNPRVGCVLAAADGTIVGEGATREAGGPHAEVVALAQAGARSLRGGTAWVTLEPCSHHGRTPPCCDALIESGLSRVVVALGDPNPQVAGEGLARLRAARVQVDLLDAADPLARQALELNIGFVSRMTRGRPWLRLKVAASLDGRTALLNGASQWITGEAARIDGHRWRRRAGAILTGIGTVREDDPRLDVRWVQTARQPLRVVVDSRLALDPAARILAPPGEVLVFAADMPEARLAAVRATGAEVIDCAGPGQKVDLARLLDVLGSRGVNELHVEAGHKLNGSLLREGLVDELLVYLAPRLLGTGREMAALGPLESLADSLDFRFLDVEPVGDDLRLRLRRP